MMKLSSSLRKQANRARKAHKKALRNVGEKIHQEFSRNIDKQSFFNGRRYKRRSSDGRPALIDNNRRMQRNIVHKVRTDSILFTNKLPFAWMHNDGARNAVQNVAPKARPPQKVRAYRRKQKKGSALVKSHRRKANTTKSYTQRANVPKRQFIGDHPVIMGIVKQEFDKVFL